jgi:hypothetical protein
MALCILSGGIAKALAVSLFTLSWTHSVQKTEWREDWAVTLGGLELRQAAIKGSGAGMEPGPDAMLEDGWWVWHPTLAPQPQVSLAASGMTPGGWTLCHAGGCIELGTRAGEDVVLRGCDD